MVAAMVNGDRPVVTPIVDRPARLRHRLRPLRR